MRWSSTFQHLTRLLLVLASLCGAELDFSTRPGEHADTLVVYSYREVPEALDSLQHFAKTVVARADTAQYVIMLDHAGNQGTLPTQGLPDLPSTAEYFTTSECSRLGHISTVLLREDMQEHVKTHHYQYYVWLDSLVDATLLQRYTADSAWYTRLTSRITNTTKLVGADIVCQPSTEVQPQSFSCPAYSS